MSQAIENAAEFKFAIGEETTCQFGNATDSSGYSPDHKVRVIASKVDGIGMKMYLVEKCDDAEYIGAAIESLEGGGIKGALYCTNARSFGSKAQNWTGIRTKPQAAYSLGFELNDMPA